MKKLLSGLILFFCAGSAWAFSVQVQPQKAVKVCARLSPKETRDACYHVIASASYDENVVGICNVLPTPANTIECLKKIKNAPFYNKTAPQICYRHDRAEDVIECLDESAGEYFEDDAVLACDRINKDVFATDCLDAVKGNTFDPGIIEQCASVPSDEEKIKCFDHNAKDPSLEQIDDFKKAHSYRLVPTFDLRQFATPMPVPKCVPEKQDCNSDVKKQIKDSDDAIRRFLGK
jgi:hypothetical protein